MTKSLGLFLLLTAMSFSCFAQEGAVGACVECSEPSVHQSVPKLDFWSVRVPDVKEAHCLNLQPPSEAMMTDYLQNIIVKAPATTEDRTINGIDFQNEPKELLDLFQNLHTVNKHEIGAPAEPKFQSACHQVICAMNEIYGKPQGLQLLYLYARYGYSATTLTHLKSANIPWTSAELGEILADLQSLPPDFFPMKKFGRNLLHSTIGAHDGCSGRDVSNSAVQIFSPWFCLPREMRLSTLTHEIGHDVAQENSLDTSADWSRTTGWDIIGYDDKGNIQVAGTPKGNPSIYGSQDIQEDFAESFASYRLSPEHLKSISPERYQYMKEHVFHGVEFTSEDCQNEFQKEQARLKDIKQQNQAANEKTKALEAREQKLIASLSRPSERPVPAHALPTVLGVCLNEYLQEAIAGQKGSADSCLKNNIQRAFFVAAGGDAETPQSHLAKIAVSEAQENQVRAFAKKILSDKLYQSYKDDDAISSSQTHEQCDETAAFFYRNLDDDQLSRAARPELLQKIAAKACHFRIQAFGTKWLGQHNNPFAKNTFLKVFSF
jgi:hypothetical protein